MRVVGKIKTRPLKIAMVTSWQEACGIAAYTEKLVASMPPDIHVQVLPLRAGETDPGFFRELAENCNLADVAHIQHEYVYFGGVHRDLSRWRDFAERLRVPWAVTVHTWLQPALGGPFWKRTARAWRSAWNTLTGWQPYLQAGQFKNADRVLVHTAAHRAFLLARGLSSGQVMITSPGVAKTPKSIHPPAKSGRPQVALFGFLTPAKGHELALAAWEKLGSPGTLVIAGKPFSARDLAYADRVRQAAARLGGHIRLPGFLAEPELLRLLAGSTLVVLPYLHATSSYALAVALGQGCAVLASDLEPFREVQAQAGCPALFRAGDAGDLTRQLGRLLGDPAAMAKLRRQAAAWAKEHGWERIAAQTADIYRRLAGRSLTGSGSI